MRTPSSPTCTSPLASTSRPSRSDRGACAPRLPVCQSDGLSLQILPCSWPCFLSPGVKSGELKKKKNEEKRNTEHNFCYFFLSPVFVMWSLWGAAAPSNLSFRCTSWSQTRPSLCILSQVTAGRKVKFIQFFSLPTKTSLRPIDGLLRNDRGPPCTSWALLNLLESVHQSVLLWELALCDVTKGNIANIYQQLKPRSCSCLHPNMWKLQAGFLL